MRCDSDAMREQYLGVKSDLSNQSRTRTHPESGIAFASFRCCQAQPLAAKPAHVGPFNCEIVECLRFHFEGVGIFFGTLLHKSMNLAAAASHPNSRTIRSRARSASF